MKKQEKTISLIELKENQKARVVSISAGWQAAKRLSDLGLVPGTKVKIIRRAILGPIEIEVRGSKFVLGRGLASKVLVEPL